jgi:hypothetical protein
VWPRSQDRIGRVGSALGEDRVQPGYAVSLVAPYTGGRVCVACG